MTILAYPKRPLLTPNDLAIVIIFIEFDELTHLKKTGMIIHLLIKWDSLPKTYLLIFYKKGQMWYHLPYWPHCTLPNESWSSVQ